MSTHEGVSPALTDGESQLGRTVLRLREMILKGEFGPGAQAIVEEANRRLVVVRRFGFLLI